MNKHLIGFLILLFAFTIGVFTSPVHFKATGSGIGGVDSNGVGSYWIHNYQSMFFVRLTHEGENYKTYERAQEIFQARLAEPLSEEVVEQKILDLSEVRAVVFIKAKGDMSGYCSVRVEEKGLRSICSTSHWHVLEFERQEYGN